MDPRSPALTARRGFGLVEVLVAMALLSVIGASALLLLRTVGDGTRGIQGREPTDPLDARMEELRDDLLHVMKPWTFSGQKGPEALRLASGQLAFVRSRIEGPVLIRYERAGEGILRVETIGQGSETNLWLENVVEWNLQAWHGGTWLPVWPPEKDKGPPSLLSLDLMLADGEQRALRLPIPAGLSVTGATQRVKQP